MIIEEQIAATKQTIICDVCGAIQPEIGHAESWKMFLQKVINGKLMHICHKCHDDALQIGVKKLLTKKESK